MKEVEPSNRIITGPRARNVKRSEVSVDGERRVRLEFVPPTDGSRVIPILVGNGRNYGRDDHDKPETIVSGGIGENGENTGIIQDERGESEGGYTGGTHIGMGGIDHGQDGETVTDSGTSKDNDKKDKKVLGKALKIGTIIIVAGLLIGMLTSKDVEYTTTVTANNYTYSYSISDLYPEESSPKYLIQDETGNWRVINGEGETTYSSSQTVNPGNIISELRERGIAESLGRHSGRKLYDSTTGDERVADEDQINQITESFDNLLKTIVDARSILEDPNATEAQKVNALETIKQAKGAQLKLYEENAPLFNKYMSFAKQTYENPADERTDEDLKYLVDRVVQWNDAQTNLQGDMQAADAEIYALQNPQTMFEEPSAPVGTVDTDHYIEVPPIGPFNGINLFKSEERKVVDLEYDSDVYVQEAGQAQEGLINSTATEAVTVKTTRYGINAFVHNFKSFGKGLMETITGKNLTDPGMEK